MHELAQTVLGYIRRHELLRPGCRVGVAVSGGSDSVALLRLLLELRRELGILLSVVHLNHKLRGAQSDSDAEFVAALAREHKLQFYSTAAEVAKHATESHVSVETAARSLRYAYFHDLLRQDTQPPLDVIATGHTLDDQAETVLMRLIRGTGMRGLRAIQPRIEVDIETGGAKEIIRPLLEIRRHQLEQYLGTLGQPWREDSTNADPKFTRNRVRHLLLPLLESEFNPAIVRRLAEVAEIARGEEDYWENEAAGWMGTGVHWVSAQPKPVELVQIGPAQSQPSQIQTQNDEPMNAILDRSWLLSEPLALQRRIIKSIADETSLGLEFRHIEEILRFATEEQASGKKLMLPAGWAVTVDDHAVEFLAPEAPSSDAHDYEYRFAVPGRITIPELGTVIDARAVAPGEASAEIDSGQLLKPSLLSRELIVRNWRAGDRFWPAHTKAAKKVKELLQDRHLHGAERKLWPVAVSGTEIVWMRGFPVPKHLQANSAEAGVLIREIPLGSDDGEYTVL